MLRLLPYPNLPFYPTYTSILYMNKCQTTFSRICIDPQYWFTESVYDWRLERHVHTPERMGPRQVRLRSEARAAGRVRCQPGFVCFASCLLALTQGARCASVHCITSHLSTGHEPSDVFCLLLDAYSAFAFCTTRTHTVHRFCPPTNMCRFVIYKGTAPIQLCHVCHPHVSVINHP
jgi:hypothetical protein